MQMSGNISGFIRRLFLQLMLEDEKVSVFLQSPCPVGIAAAQECFQTFVPEIRTYLRHVDVTDFACV